MKSEVNVQIEKGQALMRDGKFEEAIKFFLAVEPHYKSTTLSYNLGQAYFENGKFTEALSVFTKALGGLPNTKDTKEKLQLVKSIGKCLISQKDISSANNYLMHASSIANSLGENNEIEEINKLLNDLKLNGNLAKKTSVDPPFLKEGKRLEDNKQYQQAISIYTKSINEAPKEETFFRRGVCNQAIKKLKEACEDFNEAMKLRKNATSTDDSFIIECLDRMGDCYIDTCDFSSAAKYFETAIERGKIFSNDSLKNYIQKKLEFAKSKIKMPLGKSTGSIRSPAEIENEKVKAIGALRNYTPLKVNYLHKMI